MEINRTNVSPGGAAGGMAYVLWGNLYVPGANYSYNTLFATINTTSGARAASAMRARTQGTSPASSYSMVGKALNASQTFNVTATCAWSVAITSGNFQITSCTGNALQGGGAGNSVLGGNGAFVIRRTGLLSGTLNMSWSNGSGGRNTQSCAIPG